MNTLIRTVSRTGLYCLLLVTLLCTARTSQAVVTNTLLSQDFSGNSSFGFPPQDWSTDGFSIWYGSNSGIDQGSGDAGVNGSAMFNMFDYCGTENLYSPAIDASAYSGTGATVTLDFDYWWESTFWDQNNGNNTVSIYAYDGLGNQIQLAQLNNNTDFTYASGNSTEDYYDPLSDASFWQHKSFTVPASFATSTLQIVFLGDATGVCGGGGNFGLDNITVKGSLPQNITFAPTLLQFDSLGSGMQSLPKCVTISNPGPTDITINSVQIQGLQAGEFQISGNIPTTIPVGDSVDICVTFDPQGTGSRFADLVITDNSDNNATIDIPLLGTATAPFIEIDPIGTVNTSTKMFRLTSTKLGSSLEQSLLVKNSGQGSLIVDVSTYIGGDYPGEYTISRLPANPLLAGQSDTLSVIYHPTMEGLHTAKLYIISNADNGTQIVDLLGAGKLPKIVVTPSIINFDSVGVGDTSCMNVTISNPGSDTLIIRQNYLSSNDGDFIYTPLSKENLIFPPGTARTTSLCFSPLQNGARQSRLTVITNIPMTFEDPRQDTGTVSIDVTGTGVPFGKLVIALAGTSTVDSALVGTQVCRPITITNVGAADVMLSAATIAGPQGADFVFNGITFPKLLQAQHSITATICATPDARGLRDGLLTVSGISNERTSSASIPLEVFGQIACAAPAPLAMFQNVKVLKNNSDTESVVITNCGDVASTYTASVTGSEYTILSPAGGNIGPIAPNATATYQLIFTPTTTGLKSGMLTIRSANITAIAIPLSGEGACAALTTQAENVPATGVGATSTFHVTITNTGNFDWTPGTGLVTPADVYSIISVTPSTIPAGMSGDVVVQFAPKTLGTVTAELTFPNAGPCQESEVKVDFAGQGVVNGVQQTVAANGFSLEQNYPNPFVSSTTFNYTLPAESTIRITLSDMTGKVVKELVSGRVSGGEHSVTFDASQLASGTYIYTLQSGALRLSKDLVLSK